MDLEQLAERIAALEAEVETLRRRPLTMKQSYRCVCGSTTLLHFKRVLDSTRGGNSHELMAASKVGIWASHMTPFEAYVCEACGLTEWHALALGDLVVDGKIVERLVAPSEPAVDDGPYR